MNNKDIHKLSDFPELDRIVNERFPGANCSTSFNICEIRHITVWNEKLPVKVKREIKAFTEGFMAGNEELSSRMLKKA